MEEYFYIVGVRVLIAEDIAGGGIIGNILVKVIIKIIINYLIYFVGC
jgi:hypothetical protein